MMIDNDHGNPFLSHERAIWWSLAIGCSISLLTATTLEPDPRGYGTHAQLGLPPCGFLLFTGAPCPGCGLTTAFAHAVRGSWALAAGANPFGLLLFVVACICVPLGLIAGWHRWPFDRALERFALGRWALAVAGCGVALWIVRLMNAL